MDSVDAKARRQLREPRRDLAAQHGDAAKLVRVGRVARGARARSQLEGEAGALAVAKEQCARRIDREARAHVVDEGEHVVDVGVGVRTTSVRQRP